MTEKKYIVVGGVAGGATAAARLRRLDEQATILMIERGKHVSFANCGLPYYIGETIQDRKRLLVQTPEGIRSRFRIDVRTESEVIAVNAAAKTITIRDANATYEESFDALLLAPGAKPLRPAIPGIAHPRILSLRNVKDADLLKAFTDKSVSTRGSAVVIGGASMAGGRGSVRGTLFGVLILGIVTDLLQLRHLNPSLKDAVKGLVIIAAVLVQGGALSHLFLPPNRNKGTTA